MGEILKGNAPILGSNTIVSRGVQSAGKLTYTSGATGLEWGTVIPGATKTITFSGAGAGKFYAGQLVFSGSNTDKFQVTVSCGETLGTPHVCNTGSRIIGFDLGDTCDVTFAALFEDGEETTMVVTIYNTLGEVVDEITATATVQDPVTGAVVSSGGAIGYWAAHLAQPTPVGIELGDTVLKEQTGIQTSGLDIDAVIPGITPENWEIIDSDPCGTDSTSLSWALRTDKRSPKYPSAPNYYAVLDDYEGGPAYSGIIFCKIPIGGFPDDFATSILTILRLGGAPDGIDRAAGYTVGYNGNGTTAFAVASSGAPGGLIASLEGKWISIAWSSDAGAGTSEMYVQEVGTAFGGIINDGDFGTGWSGAVGPGITLFDDNAHNSAEEADQVLVAGLALFDTQKTDVELSAIHYAAQAL